MLNINKTLEDKTLTVALEGRLDTTTAPQLEAAVRGDIEGLESLVFDLADLEYISSAGLRVLLASQKTMNKQGEMKVTAVSEPVMEIFEVTGFSEILTIV